MPYNNFHKLAYYKKVVELTEQHFEPGVSTYSGIWKKYINPIYPMSYPQYIRILGMPNLNAQYEQAKKEQEEREKRRKQKKEATR